MNAPKIVPREEWQAARLRLLGSPIGTYRYLDLAPLGRDEGGQAYTMEWLRHHDRYHT